MYIPELLQQLTTLAKILDLILRTVLGLKHITFILHQRVNVNYTNLYQQIMLVGKELIYISRKFISIN